MEIARVAECACEREFAEFRGITGVKRYQKPVLQYNTRRLADAHPVVVDSRGSIRFCRSGGRGTCSIAVPRQEIAILKRHIGMKELGTRIGAPEKRAIDQREPRKR